jgi:hypothetical protein
LLSLLAAAMLSLEGGHTATLPMRPNTSAKLKAESFPLSDVKLEGGPFLEANIICAKYLLTVDPDRLLHNFRVNAGLQPKAPVYGGWESSGLAGHSLGHYLSACSQQYAATGDTRYKDKATYIVSQLAECQAHRPDGYIGAMPKGDKIWDEVKAGHITSHGFDLNGLWSPWYTNHKVMAGLLDTYRLTHNKQALQVAEKFADWAIDTTKGLTPELWEKMLACEYGGMNEALAQLSLTPASRSTSSWPRSFMITACSIRSRTTSTIYLASTRILRFQRSSGSRRSTRIRATPKMRTSPASSGRASSIITPT